MYAEHFKINVSLKDNMFGAQILCKHCNTNLFEGPKTKTWTTEEELWDKIHEVYQSDNGINFDIHLMMCKKFQESLNKI